jgi:hypothetical protein
VRDIYDTVEGRNERIELNLYVTGYEDAPENQAEDDKETMGAAGEQGQPEAAGAAGREPPAEGSAADAEEGESAPETEENA